MLIPLLGGRKSVVLLLILRLLVACLGPGAVRMGKLVHEKSRSDTRFPPSYVSLSQEWNAHRIPPNVTKQNTTRSVSSHPLSSPPFSSSTPETPSEFCLGSGVEPQHEVGESVLEGDPSDEDATPCLIFFWYNARAWGMEAREGVISCGDTNTNRSRRGSPAKRRELGNAWVASLL